MEYARQFDRIQAGYALNAGKLLVQYLSLAKTMPATEQYEGTLTISVLQSLLTQCSELLKYMESEPIQRQFFDQAIDDGANVWGLKPSFVEVDTFPEDLTLRGLLEHVRNAMSHPAPDRTFKCRPTGYTTTDAPSKRIMAYRFTDSPWVKADKRDIFGSLPLHKEKEALDRIKSFHRKHAVEGYLEVLAQADGTFEIGREGAVYWPLFEIVLPLPTLIDVAIGLANHLAQHTDALWDRTTILPLVA